MPVTVQTIRRLEVWSGWAASGGQRVAIIANARDRVVVSNIAGTDRLSFSVPLDEATAPLLARGAIVRTEQSDTTWDEWRIVSDVADDGAGLLTIIAAPFRSTALVDGDPIARLDPDGVRVYDFESVGLSPATQITTLVLPALAATGLGFVVLGTITPTAPIDLVLARDKPLAVLTRIADLSHMELDIRRVGSTGYAIDLVPQIGSAVVTADVRAGKNLLRTSRSRQATGHATRVYPFGATRDGVRATMARAAWLVTNVSTGGGATTLWLVDPAGGDGPIGFDGQLVGAFVRAASVAATLYGISASSASAQTVTIPALGVAIASGDVIEFRADATGADLAWLDSPADVATWGVIAGILDAGDIPGHRNLVANAALRSWPGTLPDGWAPVGAPTVVPQPLKPYYETGTWSMKVTSTIAATGVTTVAQPIFPSAAHPHVSGFARVWVVSGSVRVELVFTTPTGTKVVPLGTQVASNSVLGQFDSLGVSGIDANAIGATAVALRVVQNGTAAAVWYVDSAQLTQTATNDPPFVEGSGGTTLWQAANERLRTNGAPPVSYDVSLVDLAAMDPATWGASSTLVIGGAVRVIAPRLGTAVLTRITELERHYDTPGQSRITLSSNPDDLSGTLARRKRPDRPAPVVRDVATLPAITGLSLALDTDGLVTIVLIGSPDVGSLRVVISTASIPTDATVEGSAAVNASAAAVTFGVPVLPGQTVYGKAFAYTGPNGTGLRSAPMPFTTPVAAIKRSNGFADGGFALMADDATGLRANTGLTDSSGLASRKMNLSLAKASSGAPDDLRSVPDGGGYNRTTSAYVDASGRVITVRRATGDMTGDFLGSRIDNLTGTGLAPSADLAGVVSAAQLARQSGGYFTEYFNVVPQSPAWTLSGSGTRTLVPGGSLGRNVCRYAGYCNDYFGGWLPYNPSNVYRMRVRWAQTHDPTNGGGKYVFFGVQGVDTSLAPTHMNNGNQYHVAAGFTLAPIDGFYEDWAWFTGATWPNAADSQGPGTRRAFTRTNPGTMGVGTALIRPVLFVNYPDTSTIAGNGDVDIDYIVIEEYDATGTLLTYTAFSGVGSIAGGVTQGDAAGGRVLLRGRQSGQCRQGDVVTFNPPFQNTPIVELTGGAYDEPRSKWGTTGDGTEGGAKQALPQYPDFGAMGLTSSGFTARARLRQKTASTSEVTDNFAPHSLALIGDVSPSLGLTSPPALSDVYTVDLSASLTLNHNSDVFGTESISLIVAIDVDVTGTGAWSEAASYTFTKSGTTSGSQSFTPSVTLSIAGVTTSSRFRVRLKDRVDTSGQSTGTASGGDIRYTRVTGGGDQYASKTPDANDRVTWVAYEASLT